LLYACGLDVVGEKAFDVGIKFEVIPATNGFLDFFIRGSSFVEIEFLAIFGKKDVDATCTFSSRATKAL
jgi:hypothetical protein